MASGKSDDFELDDSFMDDEAASSSGGGGSDDDVAKTGNVKNSLTKRRIIDELLENRRLQRKLQDYDYDLDD